LERNDDEYQESVQSAKERLMQNEEILDFNFWPSYADLMLALVLILVLVLFLVTAVITIGTVNLSQVQRNQMNMIQSIASSYGTKAIGRAPDTFGISSTNNGDYDIEIRNEPTLQRITFSDKVLFDPDDYRLKPRGKAALDTVGSTLKKQLSLIREIQIQGHADTNPTGRFPSNVHLAAFRAIEVFKYLENLAGIDPAEHLMSATSFGEFNPVQRTRNDNNYNRVRLFEDNLTAEQKSNNRRIELLLFYRR